MPNLAKHGLHNLGVGVGVVRKIFIQRFYVGSYLWRRLNDTLFNTTSGPTSASFGHQAKKIGATKACIMTGPKLGGRRHLLRLAISQVAVLLNLTSECPPLLSIVTRWAKNASFIISWAKRSAGGKLNTISARLRLAGEGFVTCKHPELAMSIDWPRALDLVQKVIFAGAVLVAPANFPAIEQTFLSLEN